ncbi:unnamed protein product [Gordionus sp. m RMFG-2023]
MDYVIFFKHLILFYLVSCPPGWVLLPNSYTCYKFIAQPSTWYNAKGYCSSYKNSALVIIDNGPELELVSQISQGTDIWVGDEISYPSHSCLKHHGPSLVIESCYTLLPYVCELDISPNPCPILYPYDPIQRFYYPHPALPYKFIQCSLTSINYVMLCAKGTIWDQRLLTCIRSSIYPSKKKRNTGFRISRGVDHNAPIAYRNDYGDDLSSYSPIPDDDDYNDVSSYKPKIKVISYDESSPFYRTDYAIKAPKNYKDPHSKDRSSSGYQSNSYSKLSIPVPNRYNDNYQEIRPLSNQRNYFRYKDDNNKRLKYQPNPYNQINVNSYDSNYENNRPSYKYKASSYKDTHPDNSNYDDRPSYKDMASSYKDKQPDNSKYPEHSPNSYEY